MGKLRPIEWVGVFSLAGWALSAVVLVRAARRYRWLEEFSPAPDDWCPDLTIVVPACNEADTVEPAMTSLLSLDYPRYDIIAIDDRSTDGTGAILDRIAAKEPRLTKKQVRELPSGWLGKNHALALGAAEATGELILFTDADVLFRPETLRRAVQALAEKRADHMAVAPRIILRSFWERLLISYFVVMFTLNFRTWEVENPDSSGYVGIGAFNLVRASAYRSMGGHSALPMDVADDVKLGKLLKRAGARQVYLLGGDLVQGRWVSGLTGFVRGLTKNMFAGIDYRWTMLLGLTGVIAASHIFPAAGLFVGTRLSRSLFAATILCMGAAAHAPGATWIDGSGRRHANGDDPGLLYGFAYPLASAIWLFTFWRSAILAETRGGITWRGTFYPLRDLRRNTV